MKRSNKRGFTLVELVIVIAVIAILAGVMIATFAGVVNDAKESAKLQEAQQAELNQKIEDVTAKLENAEWLGWEDFENELAAQLAAHDQATSDAINDALKAYAESNANANTGLTEDQVKTIVERALEGQLTEAQVQAAINSSYESLKKTVKDATASVPTLAQVSGAVNAALASQPNVTAAEIRAIVAQQMGDAVDQITASTLTEEDIKAILNTYLPTTVECATAGEVVSAIETLVTGSTIVITEPIETLEIAYTAEKALTITGEAINTLTVNAPNGTISLHCDVTTLDVVAIANASLHVFGKVEALTLKAGHVVVEDEAQVTTVAVTTTEVASVTVETLAAVETVALSAASTGSVNVEVNGAVQTIALTDATADTTTIANVQIVDNMDTSTKVVTSATVEAIASATTTEGQSASTVITESKVDVKLESVVTTTTKEVEIVYVNSEAGLKAALSTPTNNGKVITLAADITLIDVVKVEDKMNVVLDLNGYNITQTNTTIRTDEQVAYAIDNYGIVTIKDSVGGGVISGRGIENFNIMTIEGGTIVTVGTTGGAALLNEAKLYVNSGTFVAENNGVDDKFGACALWNSKDAATVVVNGGTFVGNGTNYAICADKGNITINNATVGGLRGALGINGGTAVINGGDYWVENKDGSNSYYALYVSDSGLLTEDEIEDTAVVINGGSFHVANKNDVSVYLTEGASALTIRGGTFLNGITFKAALDQFVISGGTFSDDVTEFLADGYTQDAETGIVVKK